MTVQVYDTETKEVITSVDIIGEDVKGIFRDGVAVRIDGKDI